MLAAVSQLLIRRGYHVLSASGPRQALEIVRTQTPIQLVLSDIEMPEMRGTELICEVARLSPQTAGLLMTAGNTNPRLARRRSSSQEAFLYGKVDSCGSSSISAIG